jgi:hypothetical protein
MLIGWFGCAALFYLFFPKWELWYFLEIFTPVCLLFGSLWSMQSAPIVKTKKILFCLLVLGWIVTLFAGAVYWASSSGLQVDQAQEVAAYINANTSSGDEILSSSTIYVFLAGREMPLDISHPATLSAEQISELADYAYGHPPKYAIIDRHFEDHFLNNDKMKRLIDEKYILEKEFDSNVWWSIKVYRRVWE